MQVGTSTTRNTLGRDSPMPEEQFALNSFIHSHSALTILAVCAPDLAR